jgi:ABC-type branched-subunit amino acid transport system substrate-binding protein
VLVGAAVVAMAGTLLGGCGSSSPGSSSGPGSAKAPIKIGAVLSLTGTAASAFQPSKMAIDARVRLANSQGGINGHKIEIFYADDGTTPTQDLTAVKQLVETDHVVGLVALTPVVVASAAYLKAAGIPTVGSPTDPQFGDPTYPNLFAFNGNPGAKFYGYSSYGTYFKQEGGTKLGILANGQNQTSVDGTLAVGASAQAAGLQVAFKDLNVSFTQADFTADVAAMKRAGVNALYFSGADAQTAALMASIKRGGLQLKAPLLESGYGQETLSNSQTLSAMQGGIFQVTYAPVEIGNAGTKEFQSAMKKYENFTSEPSLGVGYGWLSADILLQGLRGAGADPTPPSLLASMRAMQGYDSDGFNAGPVAYTTYNNADILAGGGSCWYAMKLSGSTFTPVSTQPFCGTKIPNSAQNPAGLSSAG